MSDFRTWLPANDAYHGAFRMLRLISLYDEQAVHLEKLYILDFYLAYPSLLHRTHMQQDIRSKFSSLSIPKPEKEFLNLPNATSLFRDMSVMQAEAVKLLVGKEILDRDLYLKKEAQLINANVPVALKEKVSEKNLNDRRFIEFLTYSFGNKPLDKIRKSTNLKRKSM